MLRLKYADYPGIYHGFNVKEGYYYGIDTDTNCYIASSGWVVNNCLAVYFLRGEAWKRFWVNLDEECQFENVPEIHAEMKLSFSKWLEEVQGIDWNDWDENYSGEQAERLEDEYDRYYYNGIPKAIRNLVDELNILIDP